MEKSCVGEYIDEHKNLVAMAGEVLEQIVDIKIEQVRYPRHIVQKISGSIVHALALALGSQAYNSMFGAEFRI